MNLEEVKNLNKNELHNLRNKIDEVLSSLGNIEFDSSLSLFYEIIKKELNSMSRQNYPSLSLLKKKNPSLYLKIEKIHLDFIEWVKRCCPSIDLTDQMKIRAYSLLAKFSIELVQRRQIDLSLNSLVNNLTDFHVIFYSHFPGYVESGVFSLIFMEQPSLKKENGKKQKNAIDLMQYQLSGAKRAFQATQKMKRNRLELEGIKYKMRRFEDFLSMPRTNI